MKKRDTVECARCGDPVLFSRALTADGALAADQVGMLGGCALYCSPCALWINGAPERHGARHPPPSARRS